MRNLTSIAFGLITLASSTLVQADQLNRQVGINLTRPTDWAAERHFSNLMDHGRPWVTSARWTGPSNTQVSDQIPMDANGYPLSIPVVIAGLTEPQIVRTKIANQTYPNGEYQVQWQGSGVLNFAGAGVSVTSQTANQATLLLAEGHNGFQLRIIESESGNHIRNIQISAPGSLASHSFDNDLISLMGDTGVIRFMDFADINGNPVQSWEERPLPTDYSQGTEAGASLERQIELANITNATPWFNIPHQADDNYIVEMANLIKNTLNPELDFYIELSNELWNNGWGFPQSVWLRERACADSSTFIAHTNGNDWGVPGCNDGLAAPRMQIKRSMEIFYQFNQVFAEQPSRVKKVIGGWSTSESHAARLLQATTENTINPHNIKADAFAIAPYFGGRVARDLIDEGVISTTSIDDMINRLRTDIQTRVANDISEIKQLTDQYQMELIAYEGGQHLVSPPANRSDQQLFELLRDTNRDPRMGDLYREYFQMWQQSGGGLFVFFSFVGQPSQYGIWGMLESQQQTASEAPKYQAYLDILAMPQVVQPIAEETPEEPQQTEEETEQPTPDPVPSEDADADSDGVLDSVDLCPNTQAEYPAQQLWQFRYSDINGDGVLEYLPNWHSEPVASEYNVQMTAGCNCNQMLDILQWGVQSDRNRGCHKARIETFISRHVN